MDQPITPATFDGRIIHRSTPLTVTDGGIIRLSGGDKLHKWTVRLADGTEGICWTAENEPCPFEKGKNMWYTREQKSYGIKIMPYDAKGESDKERRITRISCLNTAVAMISNGAEGGATVDNLTSIAEKLYQWVEGS